MKLNKDKIVNRAVFLMSRMSLRGVGNTYMMLHGVVGNPYAGVMVESFQMTKYLLDEGVRREQICTKAQMDNGALRGTTGAIAVDHFLMAKILGDLVKVIVEQEKELASYKLTQDGRY